MERRAGIWQLVTLLTGASEELRSDNGIGRVRRHQNDVASLIGYAQRQDPCYSSRQEIAGHGCLFQSPRSVT